MCVVSACTACSSVEVIADGKYLCYPLSGKYDVAATNEIGRTREISICPIEPTVEGIELSAWRSPNSKALTDCLCGFTWRR